MPRRTARSAPKRQKTARKSAKKGKRPQTAWNKHVMQVLKELRAKDPSAQLKDAFREAKKTYKKGPAKADSWNVSSSKYSTVGKDSWNVSTSNYSTVKPKKGRKGNKGK